MRTTRRVLVSALAGGLLCLAAGHATAQAFPAKAVTIIVPFAPAGGADTLARTLAPRLSAMWGQPVIVENRPGASGHIGTEQVANAVPDGYALVMATTAAITEKNIAKLAPVALVSAEAYVVAINAGVPVNNVRELIAYAKANPGKLHFGSSGIGAASHLSGELFKAKAGIDMQHVPYKGAGRWFETRQHPPVKTGLVDRSGPGAVSAQEVQRRASGATVTAEHPGPTREPGTQRAGSTRQGTQPAAGVFRDCGTVRLIRNREA